MYQDSELPKTIAGGQYTLKKRIGQGGMAVVYVANVDLNSFDFAMVVAGHEAASGSVEERQAYRAAKYQSWKQKSREELLAICTQFKLPYPSDGKAAVKVMIPQQREDAAIRFEAEWRQLLAINHPHLIKVYGGGREGELPWYSMEVVRNIIPLKEARALPDRAKLDMIFQAAGGLQALHQRGIIHRDIKPANLLCSRQGDGVLVRVMDLGIAKLTTSTEGLTLSHHVMGTPYYMSPEQAGSSKNVDHRADIYSLGSTLYSLVCGARPYEGKSMYEVVGSLVRGEKPERPSDVRQDLEKYTGLLIERMMDIDPDSRLQSMEEVRTAIQAVFAGDGTKCAEILKVASKPARAPRNRRPPSSSGGSGRGGGGQSVSRSSRPRGRYQGHQRREIASGPLIAGGIAIIILLIALIAAMTNGGGGDDGPAEEYTPGMGEQGKRTPGSGSGSETVADGSGSRIADAGSGSEAAPLTRKDALAKMKTTTEAILGLIEDGRLSAAEAQLDSLYELAGEHELEEEFVPLKDKISTARGKFLDDLAQQVSVAIDARDKETAGAKLKRLKELDSTHGQITKLEDALANIDKKTTRPVAPTDDLTIREGKPLTGKHFSRIDGEFDGFKLHGGLGAKAAPVTVYHFGLKKIEAVGNTIVIEPRQQNGYMRLRLELRAAARFKFRLKVRVGDNNAPMHFHQCFYPVEVAGHRALDAHYSIGNGPLARLLLQHEMSDISVATAAKFDWVIVFKERTTYTFGKTLKMVPLYHLPGDPDMAKIAALQKEQRYQKALDLFDSSAQLLRKPDLQKKRVRAYFLADFERYVRWGAMLDGKKLNRLGKLTPQQAVALHRRACPDQKTAKDNGPRAIREAAYLWDRRAPGALAAAEEAKRLGLPIADELINEIKAGGGK